MSELGDGYQIARAASEQAVPEILLCPAQRPDATGVQERTSATFATSGQPRDLVVNAALRFPSATEAQAYVTSAAADTTCSDYPDASGESAARFASSALAVRSAHVPAGTVAIRVSQVGTGGFAANVYVYRVGSSVGSLISIALAGEQAPDIERLIPMAASKLGE